jgi:hypothetical protein
MAIGIVDFYHAAEHVTQVVDQIENHHTAAGHKRWVKLLLRGRLDTFLSEARAAFPPDQKETAEKTLDYFEKNRDRMRYRYFRDRGYFIGSGVVEAACKTIVAQRLKGSGMHWSEQGLALSSPCAPPSSHAVTASSGVASMPFPSPHNEENCHAPLLDGVSWVCQAGRRDKRRMINP